MAIGESHVPHACADGEESISPNIAVLSTSVQAAIIVVSSCCRSAGESREVRAFSTSCSSRPLSTSAITCSASACLSLLSHPLATWVIEEPMRAGAIESSRLVSSCCCTIVSSCASSSVSISASIPGRLRSERKSASTLEAWTM